MSFAVGAATLQTLGPGSAVSVTDRSATFDSLTYTTAIQLDNYKEGGLRITSSGESWGADPPTALTLDPFHGQGGVDRAFFAIAYGNTDWVTIRTTNLAVMHGVEFMYGNTWTTGGGLYPWGNEQGFVEWQTWRGGMAVSAGQIGPNPGLPMATIVGFYDPTGFDELLVQCRIANTSPTNLQALALDNVLVMLTNVPPAPVIYAEDFHVDLASNACTLTVYDTIPGCDYRMVYTESLNSPAWVPVVPPAPDGWTPGGGTLTFTNAGVLATAQRFYRVQVR